METTTEPNKATSSPATKQAKETALREVRYSPESQMAGASQLLARVAQDFWRSRHIAWRLFTRDVRAQYRQTILGYIWVFIPPLATAATFYFLHASGSIDLGETPIAKPAFLLIGTSIWACFVDAMQTPLKTVSAAKGMITKINFPREALLMSAMGMVGFQSLVRLVLFLVPFVTGLVSFSPSILLFPIGLAGTILLGFAIGLTLTPIGVLFKDIARAIVLLTGFWMYVTPVLFVRKTEGIGALVHTLNPVTHVLTPARAWLTGQPVGDLTGFFIVVGASLVFATIAWFVYRVSMPHIVARMGM